MKLRRMKSGLYGRYETSSYIGLRITLADLDSVPDEDVVPADFYEDSPGDTYATQFHAYVLWPLEKSLQLSIVSGWCETDRPIRITAGLFTRSMTDRMLPRDAMRVRKVLPEFLRMVAGCSCVEKVELELEGVDDRIYEPPLWMREIAAQFPKVEVTTEDFYKDR